MSFYSIT